MVRIDFFFIGLGNNLRVIKDDIVLRGKSMKKLVIIIDIFGNKLSYCGFRC